jgi:hypothetical protein
MLSSEVWSNRLSEAAEDAAGRHEPAPRGLSGGGHAVKEA